MNWDEFLDRANSGGIDDGQPLTVEIAADYNIELSGTYDSIINDSMLLIREKKEGGIVAVNHIPSKNIDRVLLR